LGRALTGEMRRQASSRLPPSDDGRIYRRRVLIRSGSGYASADVEDTHHRFGVDITHCGGVVGGVAGRPLRTPWTTCPLAARSLEGFIGKTMPPSPFAALRQIQLAEQCTHMADMGALAMAAVARNILRRRYDVEIARTRSTGKLTHHANVARDEGPISQWTITDGLIETPGRLSGRRLSRAASWISDVAQAEDEIEELFILQRAVLVAGEESIDLDLYDAPEGSAWLPGACFAFQPVRVGLGRRNRGNTRDFTDRPNALLADLANA